MTEQHQPPTEVEGLREALRVIADASERSETMFGGKMSEVTRVFEKITRVARLALTNKPNGDGSIGSGRIEKNDPSQVVDSTREPAGGDK